MSKSKRMTKAEVVAYIAEKGELDKKSVNTVFQTLAELMKRELKKNGEFVVPPALLKLKTVKKKAVPAGERRNPFTNEVKMMPAKPASTKVKASALKALKDMVQ